ncbi:hypothetical protein IPF37_00975 [bacterium]|nr:MAG: hypothetical protein IPF37_00975 [bacterium]
MKREQIVIIAMSMVILGLGVSIYAYQKGYLNTNIGKGFFEKITNVFKSKQVGVSRSGVSQPVEKENPDVSAKSETFKALREPVKLANLDETLYKQVKAQVAEEGERVRQFVDNQLTMTLALINRQLDEHKKHVAEEAAQVKAVVHQSHKKTLDHVEGVIKQSDTTDVINKNIDQAVKGIENRIQSLKQETEELHHKRYKEKKARFRRKIAASQASVADRIRDEVKKQLTVE